MSYDLTQANVLITGANRFGRGGPQLAYEFAQRGVKRIGITTRDLPKAESVRDWIMDSGYNGQIEILQAELSNPVDISRTYHRFLPDIVVNNAASFGKVVHEADETPEAWLKKEYDALRSHVASNLESVYLMTQEGVRRMKQEGKHGRFVLIGDATLHTNFSYEPGYMAYAFSKAYIPTMTRNLAEMYGRDGMLFTAFLFGPIEAPPGAPRPAIEHMQTQLKIPKHEMGPDWLGFKGVAEYVVDQIQSMNIKSNGNTHFVDAARSVDNPPEHV